MIVRDFKHNLDVDVISQSCLKRSCYVPQISFRGEEVSYICGGKILHECPIKYTEEEEKKIKRI